MRRRVHKTETVSYWKSMVDIITGLMMVILLVLMFFVLNFLISRDNPNVEDGYHGHYDHNDGYDYNENQGDVTPSLTPTETPTPTITPDPDNGGGGGGGDDDHHFDFEFEGEEGEGSDRIAVYAVMVDEETDQVIEVPGIFFELYTINGTRVTLSTHYPVPQAFTQYETTDGGWFYLPEKVIRGDYYFHQLNELPGYDFAADYPFEVEDPHEWDRPLVVRIPFGPSRNNIQVQINDRLTGTGLEGVEFDVVANGNITTQDGTIRYTNGSVVDRIICDETGYGLSSDLYLGNYTLVPSVLPYGYAAPELATRQIELQRRTGGGEYAPLMTVYSDLTSVDITVVDELDGVAPVAGISYRLTSADDAGENRVFVSDERGMIHIDMLKKNAQYELREIDVPTGYIANNDVYTFEVDAIGNIDMNSTKTIEALYRMIRVEIRTVDRLFNTPLTGYQISIIDKDGNTIKNWVSDGSAYTINGIETGVYTLVIDGTKNETTINIKDTKDVQKFNASVMTSKDYVLLFGFGAMLIIIIVVLVFVTVKILRKKHIRFKRLGK